MSNITLKNIPEEIYAAIKEKAKLHRRSINNEIIYCIEKSVQSNLIREEELMYSVRALRAELPYITNPEEIDAFKKQGRP